MSLSTMLVHAKGPGHDIQERVELGTDGVWIGRDAKCGIVLPSELVSRRHALVRLSGGSLVIEDASSNGTWVDGAQLRRHTRSTTWPASLTIGPYSVSLHSALPQQGKPVTPISHDAGRGLRREMRRRLLERLDLQRLDTRATASPELRLEVHAALTAMYRELVEDVPEQGDEARLIEDLCNEALGLGPLEALLADDDIGEIMVVDPETVFVERNGRIERTSVRFTDADSVRSVLERIVTPLGRRIDESSPLVDARLPDGSRVNAVIPPLATRGPCITIRKFSKKTPAFSDFVARGSLTAEAAEFLKGAVRARRNIVISGGTGSGKTTLLNLLSSAVPEEERIVTVEDAAELKLRQEHVVTLEARPENLEGRGAVTIRDLVKNALRMRPDRILVGECRGPEALDMLQAMNTGHDGSMTTTHANSPLEAINRLETLCLMAGLNLPDTAIRRQLAQSVHLIVQQARLADGSRKVTAITELRGVDDQGMVIMHDIFHFSRKHGSAPGEGCLRATGYLPSFYVDLPDDTEGLPDA